MTRGGPAHETGLATLFRLAHTAHTAAVARYRADWKLPPLRSPDESFSRLAQISQMPASLTSHGRRCQSGFTTSARCVECAAAVPFPWDRLDGRPLIYASLGTLQNRREPLFRCMAEACLGLDVQLVISHAGGLEDRAAAALPGDPVVVNYAPQADVLSRAALTITHAGLNTVLDSLTWGVPLVAIPLTYEQPAIARRIEWTGCGRTVPERGISAAILKQAVLAVMLQREHRLAARRIADSIKEAGGVTQAADLVERALAHRSIARSGVCREPFLPAVPAATQPD